jgi:SAM-dependent methyltransferase
MNGKVGENAYAADFVRRMDFSGCSSLLDVGCGTGAIALMAAPRLEEVIGLDYSPRMLELLMERARDLGFTHVRAIRRAWEDDWSDVPECDIVVASRSTLVADMGDALTKLSTKARRRVYLTSRVRGGSVDPEVLSAIGRAVPPPVPDYIYVLNILHGRGIHPTLDYIESGGRPTAEPSVEGLADRIAWALDELSEEEKVALAAWFAADPERAPRSDEPPRWAFISWEAGQ